MVAGQLDSALHWYSVVARVAQSGQNLETERRALIGVARASSKVGDLTRARAAFAQVLSADVGEADLLAARAFAAIGNGDSAAWYARVAATVLAVGTGTTNPLTLQARAWADSLGKKR